MTKVAVAVVAIVAIVLIVGALGHLLVLAAVAAAGFLAGTAYGRSSAALNHRRDAKRLGRVGRTSGRLP